MQRIPEFWKHPTRAAWPAVIALLAVLWLAGCVPAGPSGDRPGRRAAMRTQPPPVVRCTFDAPRSPARSAGGIYTATPELGIAIRQEGAYLEMRAAASPARGVPLSRVTLKKAPFELLAPKARKAPAVQMNAWVKAENISRVTPGTYLKQGGADRDGRSVFGEGEGMAAAREGYEELYLSINGHHYLVDERLKPMDAGHEGMPVTALWDSEGALGKRKSTLPLSALPRALWLVVLIDGDGDKCIDGGEVEAIRLEFGP